MLADLDRLCLQSLNQWVHLYQWFDELVAVISDSNLLKGGVFMAIIWWLWFQRGEAAGVRHRRSVLLGVLLGCLVSVGAARLVVAAAPMRARPLHNPELRLTPVKAIFVAHTKDKSSFPSDHAALFFALATGFFFLSPRLGLAALVYVVLVICLPRVYLGLHYPSDLLAGAAIGVLGAGATNLAPVRERLLAPLLHWQHSYPSPFYVALFLMTHQIAEMFETTRQLLSFLYQQL
ncbi:phosphatase PAP2 family protein [Hymenobacter sp. B81]|uniref:phosphatase PAP2 family protein n=1 Tax=Hymenobacter sp. B81 TaxID=3344878 RepID=UPI0037DD6945